MIGVDVVVTNPPSLIIEKSQRLLKQARGRRFGGDSRLEDIEPALVQIDTYEAPCSVGVRELQLMTGDQIDEIVEALALILAEAE